LVFNLIRSKLFFDVVSPSWLRGGIWLFMPEDFPFDPKDVAKRLLAWYVKSGRELPWRQTRDPYRIWLSEIMLQQTTVTAVIPYFEAFLKRFPDLNSLVAATVEEVVEQWAGLGYYRRARNLHAAAVKVVAEFGGRFPADLGALQGLPGIGRSTAGAILSIAFDQATPILDANVRRVLCRLFALQEPPRSSSADRRLWFWAEALTPAGQPHNYAQAIMDLGATVCLPKCPKCNECPLAKLCQAKLFGLTEKLPLATPKKSVPTVQQVALALRKDGQWLIRRRSLDGMLGGLWEFPTRVVLPGENHTDAARRLAGELSAKLVSDEVGEVRHVYSHFRLELRLFVAEPSQSLIAETQESRLFTTAELVTMPLHGAHKKLVPLLAGCQPSAH
jgi:A/G-specific adenine glycosylase